MSTSKTLGVSIAVGAALAPSFAGVFSTIDQKIASKSRQLSSLQAKARFAEAAEGLRSRTMELQRRYAAGSAAFAP
ncbi:MAG: hypothetical protein LBR31_04445 [Desulfovibrio sp.]|nr:hypothetical protein [Desulfovibrio sp.]